MSGRPPLDGLSASPAAHTWPWVAATPSSITEAEFDPGKPTTDQAWPFQCSTNPSSGAFAPSRWPTAQTSSGATAWTAYRWLPLVPGSGVGTGVQREPFQCSASVSNLPSAPSCPPTLQTADGDSPHAPPRLSHRPVLVLAVQPFADGPRLAVAGGQ